MRKAVITQRVVHFKDRGEYSDCLDVKYCEFLTFCGFLTYPMPNAFRVDAIHDWLASLEFELLVLSGGDDIGKFPHRDAAEAEALAYCMQHEIPVFGICRGMQFIATQFGAELARVDGHIGPHGLEKSELVVNSYHEWGFYQQPADFAVLNRSLDGVVESMRHESIPVAGIMWHPERYKMFRDSDRSLIKSLVD